MEPEPETDPVPTDPPAPWPVPELDLSRPLILPPVDPEFQSSLSEPLVELDFAPQRYQRLVANPFLGLLAFLGWLGVLYDAIFGGFAGPFTPMLLVLMIASLWLIPGLLQFHCLDCGTTARLSRWRRHVCPRIAERRLANHPRRLRGPTPPVQVVLWLLAFVTVVLCANRLGIRLFRH